MNHPYLTQSSPARRAAAPRRWTRYCLFLAAVFGLAAGPGFRCGREKPAPAGAPAQVPEGPAASLRRNIETLTGGHTRIVWARDFGHGQDTFANGMDLVLMGLDTRLPSTERTLTAEHGNYSRPILTPDGGTVVFSRRTRSGDPKVPDWASQILTLPWEGGTPHALRPGYAVDVWTDPATRRTWVYAFTTLRPGISANPEGYRLFRFPLLQPDKEEVIWEQGMMSGDNIQLNRAGTAASGLIPWPNAGTVDFGSGRFIRYRNGCWPSLAPDDSGVVWVFDGTHENLRCFLPGVNGNWRVPMDKADGLKGGVAYHPRWSNHPRLIAFTGPHSKNVASVTGNVSVIVSRFNDSLTALEDSVSLENPTAEPDCYPDLWVAGGETVNLDRNRIGPQRIREQTAAAPAKPAATWEAAPDGLCFVWGRAIANNLLPAEQRDSSVIPHRHARFGPRFDMLTEGGTFSVDPVSGDAMRRALVSGPWSMEMAVTPLAPGQGIPQVIFRAGPDLEIQQSLHDFIVRFAGKEWQLGAGLSPGQTTHLAFGSGPTPQDPPVVWINGQSQDVRPVEIDNRASLPPSTSQEVQFGARGDDSASWSGRLETISFHAKPLDPAKTAAHAAWWRDQLTSDTRPARTMVRAKLIKASPRASPDSIGSYRRSWTSALYEKTALLAGPDPGLVFGVAHWTILDGQPIAGPPRGVGDVCELLLEPMAAHPEMDSEHGSEEVLTDEQPFFLDAGPPGR